MKNSLDWQEAMVWEEIAPGVHTAEMDWSRAGMLGCDIG